ncbi:MAG: hypothetical protein R8K21_05505 [Mariprofundales bacterium]
MFVPYKITPKTIIMILAMAIILLLSACSGGDGATTSIQTPLATGTVNSTSPTLAQQAVVAMQKTERIPNGFYKVRSFNDEFASVYHVKSIDVDYIAGNSMSLCAYDAEQARQWVDIAILNFPGLWTYTGMSSQAWFYEFTWQTELPYQHSLALRIFRKDVVENVMATWQQGAVIIAQVQPSWRTESGIALLAEYFWNFSVNNNASHTVISTHSSSTAYNIIHEVVQSYNVDDIRANKPDDAIIIFKAIYNLDLETGSLHYSEVVQQTIYGENTATGFVLM